MAFPCIPLHFNHWVMGNGHPVHLRLIGKPIVEFLFVIIELFSLSVMAEAL